VPRALSDDADVQAVPLVGACASVPDVEIVSALQVVDDVFPEDIEVLRSKGAVTVAMAPMWTICPSPRRSDSS
jgi:hypothetical protein